MPAHQRPVVASSRLTEHHELYSSITVPGPEGEPTRAGLGVINTISNSSGFVAPYITGWLSDLTGSNRAGMWAIGIVMVLAAGMTVLLGAAPKRDTAASPTPRPEVTEGMLLPPSGLQTQRFGGRQVSHLSGSAELHAAANGSRGQDDPAGSAHRGPPILLAYLMNDEPLLPVHGYPVRAIIPGYYGANAVQWVTQVTVATGRPSGLFCSTKYNLSLEVDGAIERHQVGPIAVNTCSRVTPTATQSRWELSGSPVGPIELEAR